MGGDDDVTSLLAQDAHFIAECGKLEIGGVTTEARIVIFVSYISWHSECGSGVGDGKRMQGGMTLVWKRRGVIVVAVTAGSFVGES